MKQIAIVTFKRIALWCGLFLIIFILNACSFNKEKRENAYQQAQTAPKLQVPDDLQLPIERRAIMDVPEELDTGEIPKGLELPPIMAGIEAEQEPEKSAVTSEDEEEAPVETKKALKSEILFKPDNIQILMVESDVDTVWPRVAKAIKSVGFTIDDSNRGKFYYSISREFERLKTVIDPSKPVEMGLETPKEEHLIYVEPGEAHTEITVRNMQSEIEGTVIANQLLQQIKSNIEEP